MWYYLSSAIVQYLNHLSLLRRDSGLFNIEFDSWDTVIAATFYGICLTLG